MANQEYLVRNRMTHWQKSYPHWVSVVSIIGMLLIWELICRAGFVSAPYCYQQLFLPCFPTMGYERGGVGDVGIAYGLYGSCSLYGE